MQLRRLVPLFFAPATLFAAPACEDTSRAQPAEPSPMDAGVDANTDEASTDAPIPGRTLHVEITGAGVVTSTPASITCPSTCDASFPPDSTVELSAVPNPGHHFASWQGDCQSSGRVASVIMSADRSCTAVFSPSARSWARTYGGPANDDLTSIVATPSGGYTVAGLAGSFGAGGADAWVLALDGRGTPVWQSTYGGAGEDKAEAIALVGDGYILAGHTTSFGAGGMDAWVIRLDEQGNVLWEKAYGGAQGDMATSVRPLADGGFLVAGYTESFGAGDRDAWVLRVDEDGELLWQKAYGGTQMDSANSLQLTSDGSIVAGFTKSFGGGLTDFWVLKLTSSGDVVWQNSLGGAGFDYGMTIAQTFDGGSVVAGWSSSFIKDTVSTLWVVKLDSSGAIEWQKLLDGQDVDEAKAIQPTADGGYIIAGTTWSFGVGGKEFWMIRLDAAGEVLWQRTYGGANWDWAHAVVETPEHGFVAAGYSMFFGAGAADAWVVKVDADGSIGTDCPKGVGMASTAKVTLSNATATPSQGIVTTTDATVTATAGVVSTGEATTQQQVHAAMN